MFKKLGLCDKLDAIWGEVEALKPYRKAIVAGLLAFGAVVYTAMSDDVVTGQEWVEAVFAGLTGSGITWLVPNTPNIPKASTRTVSVPDRRL